MEILARVHSSSKQPLVNPAALGGLLLERRSVYAFDPRWTKSLRHLGIEWWIDAGLTRTKEGNAFSFKLAPGEPSELFDSPSTLPYDALTIKEDSVMARTRTETTALTIPPDTCWYARIEPEDVPRWPEMFEGNVGKYFTLHGTEHLQPHKVYSGEAIREELTKLRR